MRWSIVAACLAWTTPAFADNDARARALSEVGLTLFADGQWQNAYEQFEKAEQLRHAPTLVLYMAHCQKNLGRLLAAERLYQRLRDEVLTEDASVQFRMAKEQAKSELAALRSRIPRLAVKAHSATRIDGAPASEIRVDPGKHRVEGVVDDKRIRKSVDVPEGQRMLVDLTQRETPRPSSSGSSIEEPPWMLIGGVAALGLGAAAAIVGGVTGGMALARTNDIKSRCTGTECLPEDAAAADDANTLATVSTVSFVVAGVAVPVGITLVVIGSGAVESPTALYLSVGGRF